MASPVDPQPELPDPANGYPSFARSADQRRRWRVALAIAQACFPEEGGPAARLLAATEIYELDLPTDDPAASADR